jgi:hypothetical protein
MTKPIARDSIYKDLQGSPVPVRNHRALCALFSSHFVAWGSLGQGIGTGNVIRLAVERISVNCAANAPDLTNQDIDEDRNS